MRLHAVIGIVHREESTSAGWAAMLSAIVHAVWAAYGEPAQHCLDGSAHTIRCLLKLQIVCCFYTSPGALWCVLQPLCCCY